MSETIDATPGADGGWTWEAGWRTVVPSVHTLDEVQLRLGEISGHSQLANGITYDFLEGRVRVTFLLGDPTVARIWIAGDPELVHVDIEQAKNELGPMTVTNVDRTDGVTYERPGMRICCDPATNPERVKWVEIFKP